MVELMRKIMRIAPIVYAVVVVLTLWATGACTNTRDAPNANMNDTPTWQLVLQDLPAGLLSASGTSASDIYAVGTDPDDGLGPYVVHFDGQGWTRLNTAASGDLWWISTPMVGDSFFMAGAGGLILRHRPASGQFEQYTTPGDETLFGIWGTDVRHVFAVGGDLGEPDTGGVVWLFDGTAWTAQDLSSVNPEGTPTLFKVWGRSANEVYAVGGRGVILRFDGKSWTQLASPTTRSLFTVHGNDTQVVACGGAQSGVIIELMGDSFTDVTPPGTLQMNGTFVPPSGNSVTVGREGAVAFRSEAGWENHNSGLNLDPILDYHAAWGDPDGGIWAVGGNIVGPPGSDGILVYYGTQEVGTELVQDP